MTRIAILVFVLVPAVAGADKEFSKGTTWDCKKDPVIKIGNGKGNYTFKGECKTIEIGSGKNTVKIESVDALIVGGGENHITVGTVGSITLGGAKNVVRWKKAKNGDSPDLRDGAAGNDVAQVK